MNIEDYKNCLEKDENNFVVKYSLRKKKKLKFQKQKDQRLL